MKFKQCKLILHAWTSTIHQYSAWCNRTFANLILAIFSLPNFPPFTFSISFGQTPLIWINPITLGAKVE